MVRLRWEIFNIDHYRRFLPLHLAGARSFDENRCGVTAHASSAYARYKTILPPVPTYSNLAGILLQCSVRFTFVLNCWK